MDLLRFVIPTRGLGRNAVESTMRAAVSLRHKMTMRALSAEAPNAVHGLCIVDRGSDPGFLWSQAEDPDLNTRKTFPAWRSVHPALVPAHDHQSPFSTGRFLPRSIEHTCSVGPEIKKTVMECARALQGIWEEEADLDLREYAGWRVSQPWSGSTQGLQSMHDLGSFPTVNAAVQGYPASATSAMVPEGSARLSSVGMVYPSQPVNNPSTNSAYWLAAHESHHSPADGRERRTSESLEAISGNERVEVFHSNDLTDNAILDDDDDEFPPSNQEAARQQAMHRARAQKPTRW
ncbi:hypothetical protein FS749_005068 [Ceratobasidium sp. UAMH 11750]|nr:hypothetical protein FS749_005068 [Ceratobasidium sp. UAMH 11750]